MSEIKPQILKKNIIRLTMKLRTYLEKYKRVTKTNVFYDDLLRFQGQ